MGHFVEIGNNAGEAAPGERSADVLLTQSGLALFRDPTTGIIVPKYPPMSKLINDFGKTYTGDGVSNPETDILAGGAALSNAYAINPSGAAIGDAYDLSLRGSFTQASGTNKTVAIAVYYGAFQIFTITSPNITTATAHIWGLDLHIVIEVVGGANVGKIKYRLKRFGLAALMPAGTGIVALSSSTVLEENDAASSGTNANLVTNAARDLRVTATHSTNNNTIATTLNLAELFYTPMNH